MKLHKTWIGLAAVVFIAALLRLWQIGILVLLFVFWHVMTKPGLVPTFMFDNDRQAAFFFG